MRRVVVTGLGTINPLGNTVNTSWNSLISSKSGISKITKFEVDNYPCKIAGSIHESKINDEIVSLRDQRKIDRFITLGLIAADEAIKDSGFVSENESSFRSGVMVGSGIGGLDTIYRNSSILDNQGIKKISPLEVISKHAYFADKKLLGKGIQLFPNSVVQTGAKVGDYSILNTGSILEHDSEVGNGVHIMPGAAIGGNVIISNYVTIGMNATVMPKIIIEEGAYIGAGAVVNKDVKKNEVVAGNPAKVLKKIEHKFDLKFFQ